MFYYKPNLRILPNIFTFLFAINISNAQTGGFAYTEFKLPVSVSIRAIKVINDSTVWFGASKGMYGYTVNNGRTWIVDSVLFDDFKPDWRSIEALNDETVLLLNAGTPSYIIKTKDRGETWKTVYQNKDSLFFFDAIKFRNSISGAALADPVNGCFKIVITNDAGDTWEELSCIETLKADSGEACFAASNSSWDFYKKHIWIATGGKTSRVFHSPDFGNTFGYVNTPIKGGTDLSGIFSIDFLDDKIGVIAGGRYDSSVTNEITFAMTTDGGKNWMIPAQPKKIFGSCIQIASQNKTNLIFVAGHDGVFYSRNEGTSWNEVTDEMNGSLKKYNTLRFAPSAKCVWLAGNKGYIGKVSLTK